MIALPFTGRLLFLGRLYKIRIRRPKNSFVLTILVDGADIRRN